MSGAAPRVAPPPAPRFQSTKQHESLEASPPPRLPQTQALKQQHCIWLNHHYFGAVSLVRLLP